jgi:MFS family permease
MSKLGASPQLHLALMVPVCFVATVLLLGRFDPAPHRDASANGAPPEEAPHFARPTRFIMVLVLVTLPAMMLEGAGAEWSAIYMRDVFAATPFISGFAVALGAFTQAVTRFGADAFVERHGPALVSRVLLGVLGVGALLVFSALGAGWSLLGFGLMGVGTSVIFPLAMSAAAQRTDRPAALNVAALAQTAFVIFMVGPPLLGFVAQHFGIRWSFGIGLPLVAVALLLCGALGQRKAG